MNRTQSNIKLEKMTQEHIDRVYEIECASFSIPWSKESLVGELSNNMAYYYVLTNNGIVCGYCGMWHIITEGHITNIAVAPEYRRQGYGDMLINHLIDVAYEKEMIAVTLEVRMNNTPAHALYAKHGFKPEGIRKNYYSDTNEDAIVMWRYF